MKKYVIFLGIIIFVLILILIGKTKTTNCDNVLIAEKFEDNMMQQTKLESMNNNNVVEEQKVQTGTVEIENTTTENLWEISELDGEYYITKYNGKSINVTVPAYVEGKKITCVEAFEGNNNIETITFSDGIEYIGVRCCKDCKNLKTVKLPETLKQIWTYAFWGCENLKNIEIPANVDALDQGVFINSALENITFAGNNITYIGIGCFNNTKLKEIYIPDGTTRLNQICPDQTGIMIRIPESVSIDNIISIAPDGKETVIKGKKGSSAEIYANEHNNTFIIE